VLEYQKSGMPSATSRTMYNRFSNCSHRSTRSSSVSGPHRRSSPASVSWT
jgi:hypothetical protein